MPARKRTTSSKKREPLNPERIATAALAYIDEHGLEAMSVRNLGAVLSVEGMALYKHFPSKEAIYSEVFTISLAEWSLRVEDAVSRGLEGWQKVDLVITTGFRFFMENPEFVRIISREALDDGANLGIDLGAALRPFLQRAMGWFEREIDAGHFRRVDTEQLLITAYSIMFGYFSEAPFLNSLLDRDPMSPEALDARLKHVRNLFHVALSPTAP